MANEEPVVDGFEGPPLSPPFNLLMVTIAELEERLLCVVAGGFEASLRKRGTDPLIGSLTRPGRPVEGGTATPAWQGGNPRGCLEDDFRPKRKRLSSAPTSCLSGKRAAKHEGATGVRLVRKTQVVCDSRSKDYAASDVPEGSHVEAQRQNIERTENDVIFSEWDFRRGTDRWGSRVEQRRNESIEAVPREPPQVLFSVPNESWRRQWSH